MSDQDVLPLLDYAGSRRPSAFRLRLGAAALDVYWILAVTLVPLLLLWMDPGDATPWGCLVVLLAFAYSLTELVGTRSPGKVKKKQLIVSMVGLRPRFMQRLKRWFWKNMLLIAAIVVASIHFADYVLVVASGSTIMRGDPTLPVNLFLDLLSYVMWAMALFHLADGIVLIATRGATLHDRLSSTCVITTG